METEILHEIEDLHNKIITYHDALNEKSVWLFLSTLGCYSIKFDNLSATWNNIFQLSALIIIFIYFFQEIYKFRREQRYFGQKMYSFPEYISYLNISIDKYIQDKDKKDIYISNVKKCRKLISLPALLSLRLHKFTLSIIFYFATFTALLINNL